MSDFIFGDLILQLNNGVIAKDSNHFTTFSKNNEYIINFYSSYFKNESINVGSDLHKLFTGMTNHITHPQMVVSVMKVLSQKYREQQTDFLGLPELKLISKLIETFRSDMIFGNRYLCYKYVLQMITHYLNEEAMADVEAQKQLLKIIGEMPFELFSASESIIYTDKEGLETAAKLIEKIGKENA